MSISGRPAHHHRPDGEERDPHRRVRQGPPRSRRGAAARHAGGGAHAPAPHPDDLAGLHHGRGAAGCQPWCRLGQPARHRHRRHRRHGGRHRAGDRLRPAVLHPRRRLAGAAARAPPRPRRQRGSDHDHAHAHQDHRANRARRGRRARGAGVPPPRRGRAGRRARRWPAAPRWRRRTSSPRAPCRRRSQPPRPPPPPRSSA